MFFSLKSRSNVVLLLAMAALGIIGWSSLHENRRQVEQDRWVAHTRDVLEMSAALRTHLSDASVARNEFSRSADPKQIAIFEQMADLTLADLAALRRLTSDDPGQQNRLRNLEPLIRSRYESGRTIIEMRQQHPNDRTVADAALPTAEAAKLRAQIAEQLSEFDYAEQQLRQKESAEAAASNLRSARFSAVLIISSCLFLILVLVLLNIELSRRTKAEQAVTKQRKLLDSILSSCSDPVLVADGSGKIIMRNPAANRNLPKLALDIPRQQIPQMLGFFKPDGATLYAFEELALTRAVRGEAVNGQEVCVRSPDSKEAQWFLEAGNPLRNEKGENSGGVVFLRDITRRKQADERLQAALLESEANTLEKSELARLGDVLQACHTVEEACKISETILPAILNRRPGTLFLMNSSRNLLEVAALWNDCSTHTEQVFNPCDCWALRLGKSHDGGGPCSPLRCSHVASALHNNYVCAPLVAQGETLGVLYVQEEPNLSASPAAAREHETLLRKTNAVAERLSLDLSNLKLREELRSQSVRDPLTGLFNRRYLEELLMREVHRATRKHRNIAVIMIDLDHYKLFNDTFGHQAGDLLLQEISGVIKANVRGADLACRYGGEEFVLILSEVDAKGARVCVETIRGKIKQLALQHRGQSLSSITISAGIAEFPSHGETAEDLIHAADAALYQAKREGRDRVITCEHATYPVSG